jgi:4-hydroxy-2-oxoheptanedioate aldolase
MDAMINRFTAALLRASADRPVPSLTNGCGAELCTSAGFSWFLIAGEHARNILSPSATVHALWRDTGRAARNDDPDMVKLLLDMGVQTFLIPHVESTEQARHATARRVALGACVMSGARNARMTRSA